MTRLDRSIQGLIGAVAQILFSVLPSMLFLAMAIAIMFRLDSRLAALALVFAPMPALIAMRAAPVHRQHRGLIPEQ
jgi:ATP-binding cassette, subfamily B, bacterial